MSSMALCGNNLGYTELHKVFNVIELGFESPVTVKKFDSHYAAPSLTLLALFSLSINTMMMIILKTSSNSREKQANFRQQFIYLSGIEIVFIFCFMCHYALRCIFQALTAPVLCSRACLIFCLVFFSLETVSLGTRNWIITAIAMSRCLIISRALGSVRRMQISPCVVKTTMATVLILNVVLVQFKNYTAYSSLVCDGHNPNFNESVKESIDLLVPRYQEIIVISLIRGIPITCVVVCTIIILITLLCKRKTQSQAHTAIISATKILLVVTIVFTAFEGFGYCFFITWELTYVEPNLYLILFTFDKYLMVANSLANITPYVLFNKEFRNHLMDLLCRRRSVRRSRKVLQVPMVTRRIPEGYPRVIHSH